MANSATPRTGSKTGAAFTALLLSSVGEHAVFIVITLVHLAAALAFTAWLGLPWDGLAPAFFGFYGALLLAALLLWWLAHTLYVISFVRPRSPISYIYRCWRFEFLSRERLALALPILILWPLYSAAFSRFKIMIPMLHPYNWDADLAHWDQWLHFGTAPWVWLQPITGGYFATGAISFIYQLWFFVFYGFILWQALSTQNRRLRMQFLLSNLLAWILLGNVAATWLASGGPVYYARLTGLPDIYAPLMHHLQAAAAHVPVWSLTVQNVLWSDYINTHIAAGRGISAMPSMHMASSLLFTLVSWHTNRYLGCVMCLFTVFIMLGSVSLGWHYAIDGYAGLAGAYAIWRATGWYVDNHYSPA